MSESTLYVAFTQGIVPFNRQLHVPGDGRIFSLTMKEIEGQYAEIEIVREQTGLSFLRFTQPKGVVVSWSPTGEPEDARLVARGRVTELPGDLFGPTQTLVVQCAPQDIDARLLDYAKTKLGGLPYVDPLFSDYDEDDPQSYLAGRGETFHVHPATHAITTTDDLDPEVLHDMRAAGSTRTEDGRVTSSAAGDFGPPVRQLRAKLTVEWTQQYAGSVNIAPAIGAIETLESSFDMKSALTAETAEGWSMVDNAFDVRVEQGKRSLGDLGTIYRAKVEKMQAYYEGGPVVESSQVTTHRLRGKLKSYMHICTQMRMAFDWKQDRSETANAVLTLPIHETGIEREEDVIEMSLNDILGASEVPPYAPGKFRKGDRVFYNGQTWISRKDHLSVTFDDLDPTPIRQPIYVNGNKISELIGYEIYWRKAADPLSDDGRIFGPSSPGFLSTDRGRLVLQHVMMRLRKEGRRRMRCLRVRLEYSWDESIDFSLRDGIRFEIFEGDGGWRDVVGKVVSIERTWPEAGAPTCVVEVGVSIGTGSIEYSDPYFADDFATPGYDEGRNAFSDMDIDMRIPTPRQGLDLKRLHEPAFVVQSVRRGNTADVQMSAASSLAAAGKDVRDCVSRRPTWMTLSMKPVVADPVLETTIDIEGRLTHAFGGITL